MSLRSRILAACTVAALAVGGSVIAVAPAQAAVIKPTVTDTNLVHCITKEINSIPILSALLNAVGALLGDVLGLVHQLDCSGQSITDIVGLQSATGLTSLELDGNSILDLSALTGLTIGSLSAKNQTVALGSVVAGLPVAFPTDASGNPVTPAVSAAAGVLDLVNHTVTWIAGGAQQFSWNDGKGFSGVATAVVTLPILPKPTISGTTTVGQVLRCTGDSGYRYQWYRNGIEIAGATGQTYTLTIADADSTITVKTATTVLLLLNAASTSDPTAPVAIDSAVPTVSGAATVGSLLSARPGVWSAGLTLSYQWKRSSARSPLSIPGATAATYVPTSADVGLTLTVFVTGTATGTATGSEGDKSYTVKSEPTAIVTVASTGAASSLIVPVVTAEIGGATPAAATNGGGAPATVAAATSVLKKFARTPAPRIVGKAIVGRKLTVAVGAWTKKTAFTYRWKANGKAVAHATHKTFTVTKKYTGKKLTVTVTAHLAGYAVAARMSVPTKRVAL